MLKAAREWCASSAFVCLVSCGGHPLPATRSAATVHQSACAVSWVRELVSSVNASVVGLGATPDGGVVGVANVYQTVALRDDRQKLASFERLGEMSAVVFKLSAEGGLIWSARLGAHDGRVETVALTTKPDGSVLLSGRYRGAPRIQLAGHPDFALPEVPLGTLADPTRLFVAYLAPDGTPTRVVTSNDLGAVRQIGPIAALGDDVVVVGYFTDRVSFGQGSRQVTLNASGGSDAFVVRLDPSGQPRWARRLGGTGDDYSSRLAVTPQGSILISGTFSKPYIRPGAAPPAFAMTFGESSARLEQLSRADAFIAAIDGNGSLAWWQAIGGGEIGLWQRNGVHSIANTPEGDIWVVGEGSLPLQIGAKKAALSAPGETFAGFLARFSSAGALRTVQSLGAVKPTRIATLPDGDFVVSAQADDEIRYPGGKASVSLMSAGLTDLVLARHAPDGRLRWATHFGGDGEEWAGELAVDSRGAVFVEGASHTNFSFERPRCEAVPVRVVARDHPNSFLFRVEPGADPSDAARELKQRELRDQAEALRAAAKTASQNGDEAGALSAYRELTSLLPDDPRAWVELAAHLEQQDQSGAIEADLRAITLGSRHRDVILEADAQARKDAYLSLARLGPSITLPASGCQPLAPAAACTSSLYACVTDSPTGERVARIGTSAEHASLAQIPDVLPNMPALGRYPGTDADTFASFHHWFQRADNMDVLLSDQTTDCRVVTADACLGLIGVVCNTSDENGGDKTTTVDEFYLWRTDDQRLPADP